MMMKFSAILSSKYVKAKTPRKLGNSEYDIEGWRRFEQSFCLLVSGSQNPTLLWWLFHGKVQSTQRLWLSIFGWIIAQFAPNVILLCSAKKDLQLHSRHTHACWPEYIQNLCIKHHQLFSAFFHKLKGILVNFLSDILMHISLSLLGFL